jgi:hypothetical protein
MPSISTGIGKPRYIVRSLSNPNAVATTKWSNSPVKSCSLSLTGTRQIVQPSPAFSAETNRTSDFGQIVR